MADVKRLLAEATPLPWAVNPWEGGASGGTASVCAVGDTEVRSLANGATPAGERADADLIVYAVNRLPDYETAVESLERVARQYHGMALLAQTDDPAHREGSWVQCPNRWCMGSRSVLAGLGVVPTSVGETA